MTVNNESGPWLFDRLEELASALQATEHDAYDQGHADVGGLLHDAWSRVVAASSLYQAHIEGRPDPDVQEDS